MTRIRLFGVVLVLVALYGAYFFFAGPGYRERPPDVRNFLIGLAVFYVIAGLGALFPTRAGYCAFKAFLFLLLVAFPIGTVIAWTTLSYMRRHGLKREFGFAR